MMTTPAVSIERRIGQRFPFTLPISVRDHITAAEGLGFTQDVSSRGAFFFTDMPLNAGAEIELTLKMPSEITLGETMRVRCKGRILRVVKPMDRSVNRDLQADTAIASSEFGGPEDISTPTRSSETKIGVAVCFNEYEYLSETEDGSADFRRISALHGTAESDRPSVPIAGTRGAIH
jgi:PilZ domain